MELINGEDTPKESHEEPVVLVTQKSHSPRGNSDQGLRVSRVTPTSNLSPLLLWPFSPQVSNGWYVKNKVAGPKLQGFFLGFLFYLFL